jgi:predicted dehydrogenase
MRSGRTVLVIGLGQIGMGYDIDRDPELYVFSHARAFDLHPGFTLVGGVDPDKALRRAFRSSYGVDAYETAAAALANEAPELVVIAVPTPLHGLILDIVLQFPSVKTIVCEKPLSYDLNEARHMASACENQGVQLVVNYMRRSDPAVIEVRRRLVSGSICGPIKGVVWYGRGLIHNGSHFFNLLEYWLGDMIDYHVVGLGLTLENGDADVDVSIRFERGKVLFLSTDDRDFAHYELELMAYNGRLRYELAGHRVVWQQVEQSGLFENSREVSDMPEVIESGMRIFQYNVASQVEALMAGQPCHLSLGSSAERALEALIKIIGDT